MSGREGVVAPRANVASPAVAQIRFFGRRHRYLVANVDLAEVYLTEPRSLGSRRGFARPITQCPIIAVVRIARFEAHRIEAFLAMLTALRYGLDTLRFVKPVGIGDTIRTRLTCKRKTDRQKKRVTTS